MELESREEISFRWRFNPFLVLKKDAMQDNFDCFKDALSEAKLVIENDFDRN